MIAAHGEYVYWKDKNRKELKRGKVVNGKLDTSPENIDDRCVADFIAVTDK